MISTGHPFRRSIFVVAVAPLLVVSVARADIRLISSMLKVESRARVDPHVTDQVETFQNTPAPDALQSVFLQATVSDSDVVSETVDTTVSTEVTASNAVTVHVTTMRFGTDATPDEPGGIYSGTASFELSFLALADGTFTVGEAFQFTRPNTGTFTPLGLRLESGTDIDTRPIEVAFDDQTGSGGSPQEFTIQAGRGYLLRIDVVMVGGSSDVSQPESWDGVFTVQLPDIAPLTSSTTTSTTVVPSTSTTSTTLPPLCPFTTPGACASGLPRSITRRLKQGCVLADRADTVSEHRATKLRKRSDAKLLGACRTTSKAQGKGKLSRSVRRRCSARSACTAAGDGGDGSPGGDAELGDRLESRRLPPANHVSQAAPFGEGCPAGSPPIHSRDPAASAIDVRRTARTLAAAQ